MANGKWSCAFYMASARHMASIRSGIKGNVPPVFSSVFSNRDCAVLQGAEHLLFLVRLMDAVSTWEYRDMGGIKSDPLCERDQPITASVHIIFSFDCCRPKYLFFFYPFEFLISFQFQLKISRSGEAPIFSCLWHWHNKLAQAWNPAKNPRGNPGLAHSQRMYGLLVCGHHFCTARIKTPLFRNWAGNSLPGAVIIILPSVVFI